MKANVPTIRVNPSKDLDSVKIRNRTVIRSRKGTEVVRDLKVGRLLKTGELVEVINNKPNKQKEVKDGQ